MSTPVSRSQDPAARYVVLDLRGSSGWPMEMNDNVPAYGPGSYAEMNELYGVLRRNHGADSAYMLQLLPTQRLADQLDHQKLKAELLGAEQARDEAAALVETLRARLAALDPDAEWK